MVGSRARWGAVVLASGAFASSACGGRALTEDSGAAPVASAGSADIASGGTAFGGSGSAAQSGASSALGGASPGYPATGGAQAVVDLAMSIACVKELKQAGSQAACPSCSVSNDCCTSATDCPSLETSIPRQNYNYCSGAALSTTCQVSASSSGLSGYTPNGPLSLEYAWKKQVSGFGDQLTVFFTHSSTATLCEETSFGFKISSPHTGLTIVPAILSQGGAQSFVSAYVQLDTTSTAITAGTVDVYDEGWSLHGKFLAPDCEALDSVDDGK